MTPLDLIKETAKGYNQLDAAIIKPLAADHIIYESQWVLDAIHSKEEVFKYLENKFEVIKQSGSRLFAEIAYNGETPCIILAQNTKENKVATLLVEITNHQLSRLDICEVPHWRDLKGTNEYP